MLPARRKDSCIDLDAVRVIPVRLMKNRKFANGKINIVGEFRVITRIHIGIFRQIGDWGKVHLLGVNGLTADNDDFGVTGDSARRADDVFELSTIHRWRGVQPP